MKEKILIGTVIVLVGGIWLLGGCESSAQTGALLGGGAGALAGQAIGRDTKSTLIGTAVGAGAGYMIGSEKDKQRVQRETRTLSQQMNTVTVNVVNSNGSISPVTLTRQGVGYVGPRGEFYDHLPTGDELKPIYGF